MGHRVAPEILEDNSTGVGRRQLDMAIRPEIVELGKLHALFRDTLPENIIEMA